MILRKKGFTLIEMLVVIMIIAILAAALFPAITGAINQAKATAMRNKGRGIWTSVISANAEREPLGMLAVWPTNMTSGSSTLYFQNLIGSSANAICEDLKVAALSGSGIPAAADPSSFGQGNNAWCIMVSSNTVAEDAFIYTRNIDFFHQADPTLPTSTLQKGNNTSVANSDYATLTTDSSVSGLGAFNLNRGIYVTYGGACLDRRQKYIGVDSLNNPTNNLVSSTVANMIYRP